MVGSRGNNALVCATPPSTCSSSFFLPSREQITLAAISGQAWFAVHRAEAGWSSFDKAWFLFSSIGRHNVPCAMPQFPSCCQIGTFYLELPLCFQSPFVRLRATRVAASWSVLVRGRPRCAERPKRQCDRGRWEKSSARGRNVRLPQRFSPSTFTSREAEKVHIQLSTRDDVCASPEICQCHRGALFCKDELGLTAGCFGGGTIASWRPHFKELWHSGALLMTPVTVALPRHALVSRIPSERQLVGWYSGLVTWHVRSMYPRAAVRSCGATSTDVPSLPCLEAPRWSPCGFSGPRSLVEPTTKSPQPTRFMFLGHAGE